MSKRDDEASTVIAQIWPTPGTQCHKCSASLQIGEYPFCPHGFPAANSKAMVDEWPMGKTFENGLKRRTTFYSRSAYTAALAANGMKVRGDGEESGCVLSAVSLRNAEELVKRCS